MPMLESLREFFTRAWVRWTLLTLLALGAGWALAVLCIPAPRVGVIYFGDVIWYDTIIPLEAQIRYAETDPSIRAVVIVVDSPGGETSASERLYFDILRLRRSKPVIVMVDSMAASGGYYMVCAADEIFVTPSSMVGNIGVISTLPPPSIVVEDYLFSGPFKAFGSTRDSYMRQMEIIKDSFLESVFAQREAQLEEAEVDRAILSRGEIYVGAVGLQMGLADHLGSRDDAVARAAELARIRRYTVVDVAEEMVRTGAQPTPTPFPPEAVQERLSESDWPPVYYFLYLAPQEGGQR